MTDPKGYGDGLEPQDVPLALVVVDGGIAEQWYVVAGCGEPEIYILDMDREGEEPEETAEFVIRARDTMAIFAARGVDTSGLAYDVDKLDDYAERTRK